MTSLHDRLLDLADHAPAGGPDPTLWGRGRRAARRRLAGTVAIVVVALVALVGLGALSWQRAQQPPAPAGPSDGLRLPDVFYAPDGGLDGTDDAGELGAVTAVLRAPRDGGSGLVGISGSTGAYRFLDLPGWVGDDHVALAADGRRVGYWYGEPASDARDARIDGVAVYDTVDGEVSRLPVASEHGLLSQPLLLTDDELWFARSDFQDDERTAAAGGSVVAWQVGGDVVRTWDPADGPVPSLLTATASGSDVAEVAGRRLRQWSSSSARPEERRGRPRLQGPAWRSPRSGSSSASYAALVDADGPAVTSTLPQPVAMVLLTAPGRVRVTRVPGLEATEVMGWHDSGHFVTYDGSEATFDLVKLATGSPTPISRLDSDRGDVGLQVAADAWSGPVYQAEPPPDPLSRWVVGGAVAGVVGASAVALLWWRRRARA